MIVDGHLIAPSSRPDRISRLRMPAMTTIGMIATRAAADIAHHSSPRWLFWPATRMGRVCHLRGGQEEREQELVPDEGQRDHEGGDQARLGHGHHDTEENPPGRHIVDHRRLLDLDRQGRKKSRISQITIGSEKAT